MDLVSLTLDGVGACELVWEEEELSPGLRGGFWRAFSNAAPRPPLPNPEGGCPPEAILSHLVDFRCLST